MNVDSEEEETNTNLDDTAEIRAEERRGGAGGPPALGRRRGQHRSPLSFLLLLLRSRDLLPLLLPAYSPLVVVVAVTAAGHARSGFSQVVRVCQRFCFLSFFSRELKANN